MGDQSASEPAITPWGRISTLRSRFLIAFPFLLLIYVYVAARGINSAAEHTPSVPVAVTYDDEHEPNGTKLFLQHCAKCHGERGQADGITSASLNPWARKFGEERFQLATTTNGMPVDEDLLYIIQHGIPGTAMPDFASLHDAEKAALVKHVRALTWAGLYRRHYQKAEKDDDIEIPKIVERTAKDAQPGPRLEVPKDLPWPSEESIARGRKFFTANCATCHGPEGKGDGPQVKGMENDNKQPTFPRDLARGVFKGGGTQERLYYRLALGMPGTPMPGIKDALKPHEIGDVVNFVKSLSAKPN
jgi:mono/diheme cytochrome c family protein